MQIEIVEPSGYCAGVARAVQLAKQTREKFPNNSIVVLGMLVHNQDALKELDQLNIKTMYNSKLSLLEMVDEIPNNSIVILTAHGHDKKVEQKLNEKGLKFIDATCFYVTQSDELIRKAINEGRDVFYLGKKGHPEAEAALSISEKVHLISNDQTFEQLQNNKIQTSKPLFVSQTTFSIEEMDAAIKNLSKIYKDIEIAKGVCNASSLRQEGVKKINSNVDMIIVVGGLNSNNTKTVVKVAKEAHPNCKVIQVENTNDIKKGDLEGHQYIAIASGASTPNFIVEEVANKIKLLCD